MAGSGSPTIFRAPWGMTVRVISCVTIAICLATSIGTYVSLDRVYPAGPPKLISVSLLLLALLPLLAAPFAVRWYELEGRTLRIQRFGWTTDFALDSLITAVADPTAMKSSWKLFGNGGMYVYAGLFANKKLGRYRAFVTDPARSVALEFSNRTIVISPEDPEAFVAAIQPFCSPRVG